MAAYFNGNSNGSVGETPSPVEEPNKDLHYVCAYAHLANCPGKKKQLSSCRDGKLERCPQDRGLHYSCQREAEKQWGVPITVQSGELYCPECHPDKPASEKDSNDEPIKCSWDSKFECLEPGNELGHACGQCIADNVAENFQGEVHEKCMLYALENYPCNQDELVKNRVYCPDCYPFLSESDQSDDCSEKSGDAQKDPSSADNPAKNVNSFQDHVSKKEREPGPGSSKDRFW